MDKKVTLQLISVALFKSLFIFLMILSVSMVSIKTSQNSARPANKNLMILGVNKARFSGNDNLVDPIVYGLPSKYLHKKGHLYLHKKGHLFHPIILKEASRYEIDPALVKAIIMAESGYNPKAVSKRGAKGLMQLMPDTAQALGVEDIFNPKQNISGGVRYLKQLVNRFDGDIELALAAYNAGSRKVRHYQGVPPFKATHHYIQKVFKFYHLYKDQMTRETDRA